ncbi:hypothetical protein [Streptomyces sp. NPDC008092]|uniref:hypothetical protein n=1 Tax=Streptomyces sp. NPDC008092 TaxID=3364808 RepID=UPI0036EA9C60
MNEFARLCEKVPDFAGYVIDRLSMSRIEEADALDIGLRWGPGKPDVTLSFRDVFYFTIGRIPGPGAEPLDRLAAQVLQPQDQPWPDGLSMDLVRSASLPTLIWVRAEGPVQLSVVAAIATIFMEAS